LQNTTGMILQQSIKPESMPNLAVFLQKLLSLLSCFSFIPSQLVVAMPCGRKRKRHKIATHKRKKRLRKNRHKKKS
jgi:hypothetical protein